MLGVWREGHRDADTRHLLLANEWARSYRREKPDDIGDGALESAKGAYSAYVMQNLFTRWFADLPAFDGSGPGSSCFWFVDLRFFTPGRPAMRQNRLPI